MSGSAAGTSRLILRAAAIIALCVMFAALGMRFGLFLEQGWKALHFADELDYGEGIVWQQALSMFSGEAYGPIDRFPAIVYHYTPFYHAATAALSGLSGYDMLATGRFLSLAATITIALFAGALARRATPADAGGAARLVVAAGAALGVFCLWPVLLWAPLMRVDMLAVALGFAGLFLGLKALERPWLIHAAALAFVASVYTKQTSIVAPAALFALLLFLDPRLAIKGIATTIAAGLVVLLSLAWVTDGGFVRHVFLYNINRFEPHRLFWIIDVMSVHALFFGVALIMTLRRLRTSEEAWTGRSLAALRARLSASPADTAFVAVLLYLVLAWLMAFTVAKSGSSVNYFIEWLCVLCVIVGIALGDAARIATARPSGNESLAASLLAAVFVPLLIGLQAVMLEPLSFEPTWSAARTAELDSLSQKVRAARKPLISDDMVLLIRSGKPVVWEPAIFAELAHTGVWDERPFVERIKKGEFAFFVTVGTRGDRLFDSRYNPAVADAMDAAYPVKESQGGFTIHLPAGSSVAPSQQPQP